MKEFDNRTERTAPLTERVSGGELLKRRVFFFPLCFGYFHLFIFYVFYFWNRAIEIPLFFGTLLFVILAWRTRRYIPFLDDNDRMSLRSLSAFGSRAEIAIWWAGMVALFSILKSAFGFPDTLSPPLRVLGLGYLLFFVGLLPVSVLLKLFQLASFAVFKDLIRFANAVSRLCLVMFIYFAVDVFFAILYRAHSLHSPAAFGEKINGFGDALYFSTVTIATVGYGDIYPMDGVARVIVCLEIFLGIVLLGGVLSIAISIGMSHENRESRAKQPQAPVEPQSAQMPHGERDFPHERMGR